jgi:predicted cobalt transporter CbtA
VAVEHADVNLVSSLMFVAAGAAMIGAGVSARRSPPVTDRDPRLWFLAGGMFLLAAAVGLLTHFIS